MMMMMMMIFIFINISFDTLVQSNLFFFFQNEVNRTMGLCTVSIVVCLCALSSVSTQLIFSLF